MSTGDSRTPRSVVLKAKNMDERARNRIVDLYHPLIYSWVRRTGLQEDDVIDVVQEVWLASWRSLGTFQHDEKGATFRGWLRVITRNKVNDYFQGNRPVVATGGSDALDLLHKVPFPVDSDSLSEENRLMYESVTDLIAGEFSTRDWKVFWRRVVDGLPSREVAAEFGMSDNAVDKVVSRIRKRVQDEFGELMDGDSF